MSNTITTIALACCIAIVDRVQAWGILPFWPSLIIALVLSYLLGRYATGVMLRWWRGDER